MIKSSLDSLGHATNAELLIELRRIFPELSATTVHRATTRLASRGEISIAPPSPDGSIRYDRNNKPHDHFQCQSCGLLKDTDLKDKIIPVLESSIPGCSISGRLTISGVCKICINKSKEKNEDNNF
jgi:Fur family peroxide stress response transcriptional regulator